MKNTATRLQLLFILLTITCTLSAQRNFWTDEAETAIAIKRNPQLSLPKQYRTLRLDIASLSSALRTAPKEFTQRAKSSPFTMLVPMLDGSFKSFKIAETSIMEQGLADKFSNVKTYGGQGIEDPHATIKIDLTEFGFHAMILSQINGAVLIDPYAQGNVEDYVAYNKKDLPLKMSAMEEGLDAATDNLKRPSDAQRTNAATCIGGTLKQYRLAVACTWQYAVAVGGRQVTPSQALSAIVTTVNRVDGVYENEVGVRMILVSNNNKIVFLDSASQPFTGNSNAVTLINESQKVIDSLIGSANYDVGHTFSTGAGGYAGIGVVCTNGLKARGVTGSPQPTGDAYNIDYVAHELGHQFGAQHTFNANTGNCGGANGSPTTNAEPGSGSTIMAYAGICNAVNNLQPHTLPYFHAISFDQITQYINSVDGSLGAVQIATGNRAPVVNAGADYVIPKATPFALTGSASDADGDPLTYSWEQVNVGALFGDWNKPLGDAPIFRSFTPVTTPRRFFPQLSDLVNNTTTIGELLPAYGRAMKFRLTARDNRTGGGGVCSDEANVTVDGNAGPFVVTAPNTAMTWDVGSFTTITWDVASTNLAPVNCANVNIELSTDGGLTFPITLVSNTPNDGTEEIIVPNNATTNARVRVVSAGNIFFDISNVDFIIKANAEPGFSFSNPLTVAACNNGAAGTLINTNSLNKFSTPITLSASGNPAGSVVAFGTNPLSPGSNDSIILKGNIPAGIYNITITGTAGSITRSRVIQFVIGTPTKLAVNTTPANNSIGAPMLPTFSWQPTTEAQYYTLNISNSQNFATNVQSIDSITNSSYTLTAPLAANTQYYWRVVPHNSCGAGPASASSLFKTAAIVCSDIVYSKNLPIAIDVVANTITSTLNIPSGGIIQDINVVGLKGTHSYVGDLTVNLISPSNTKVQLFRRVCDGDDDFDINFDDQSANIIICPLNDGRTSKPSQPLSAFINENSTGTWKLEVIDSYTDDGGSLTNWGLKICTYQASALPVNWVTFTADKKQDKTVALQWSAINEINNKSYEIEKSIDGISFGFVGEVNAANGVGLQQYSFNDVKPNKGDNYYRLKQVDKDGKYSYSKIVKVELQESAANFMIFPNPAVDKSTVRVLTETKQLTITLSNAAGKLVYKRDAGFVSAGQEFEIPVKGFSKGLYVLTLSTEKGISNEKIIVQ
ncbi:reprolysin-like metallopeptidase [Segetibacter aerophilus]|uniref:Metalloprotease Fpp1 n=1 Tax=Segetibacter aerophilus TaxID=670293 RepID=A0A512BJS6_9BACT|nr:zinc-dependent metalloprotease family protein [Segetibacter aerophilus]GEO12067.1 metalloprotease Fpp1 [Segetibacter aerophilus]